MTKRRHISFLPTFYQTADLSSFFASTVDETFQPGVSEQIAGYIGRQTAVYGETLTLDIEIEAGSTKLEFVNTDNVLIGQTATGLNIDDGTVVISKSNRFIVISKPTLDLIPVNTPVVFSNTQYQITEPTASRIAYQLESGMISLDANSNINSALTYPDLVSYLESQGAIVSDHQRLFETVYYSWAPPINIDMLINHEQYYWFGDATGYASLPILSLTIPYQSYVGDGVTTEYGLPISIEAVSIAQENPAVFVDTALITDFSIANDIVILDHPPPLGSRVVVARVLDFAATISGMQTVNVLDINAAGVATLSSGMRIRINDMARVIGSWDASSWDYHPFESIVPPQSLPPGRWDDGGGRVYFVDGVGSSLRLTPDSDLIYDSVPQYVTIDRSSRQHNLWSSHNLWVHKNTFAWANVHFQSRKANRPIIEFIRDLVMYPGQVWDESKTPLFMLYDLDGVAYDDPGRYPHSTFDGNRIFGYRNTTASPYGLSFDQNGYIIFNIDMVTSVYNFTLGPQSPIVDITGMPCYQLDDTVSALTEPLWHLAPNPTTQGQSNGFYDVPLNLQANPNSLEVTQISQSTWHEHFKSLIANQTLITGQAFGDNSYRDTARDLRIGVAILQHRAPLLKTMLLANNVAYDLPQAIRMIDQEYDKFRNKFVRKLTTLNNNGKMADIDPIEEPQQWVEQVLTELKRDKNPNSPFVYNQIGGDQWFIPPTPTALGVLPAAIPAMVDDYTQDPAVSMIQGHDGSLTTAFGDWRDTVILELESMIYQNLPEKFRTEARPVFDIQQWTGGRFYAPYNGYSRDELATITSASFELWAQRNHLDYKTNSGYDPYNPFTWNYYGTSDRFNNPLPGHWRGIYRWYYGTDSPHTRPWEMLGFMNRPTWWVSRYGTNYTPGNIQLWTDLENGMIAQGVRSGVDLTYARPGLSEVIPVDHSGRLLDPVAAGIVTSTVIRDFASGPWQVGDGPVANLWMSTPSYRYSLAIASFLMKPARFVEECWDTVNVGLIADQWVVGTESDSRTFNRPQNSLQYVFGEPQPDGSISTMIGISEWISDYLAFSGVSSGGFGANVRTLDVRLMHPMAGFVSLDNVRVIADNFGLVPSEDINNVLYGSPTLSTEVYSGVIIEWTGRSWQVIGYDGKRPSFTIIPPDITGPKSIISLGTNEPSIVQWRSNTYFSVGILVSYQHSVYQALRSHTSGPQFEQTFWHARADLATSMMQAPRVIKYLNGSDSTEQVAYGTEFGSYQEIADFLLGWERWLVSRGWIFDSIDPSTGDLRNWSLAVKEFLTWAQVSWAPGNFIALSPGLQDLKYSTDFGMILNVESNFTGFFGLLDRAGKPITERNAIENRLDSEIILSAKNADIFSARLEIAEIEHTLIFNNTTIFDDNIYLPLFNLRQPHLQLACNRSSQWAGRMDAPGFIIIGDQLKSSFDKAANDVRLMFDIELADRKDLSAYARHVIGYQHRDYFERLLLSDVEQTEFYQGMIQQKGTPSVFGKLMRSNRTSNNSSILFLEEWAVRAGKFGAPEDPTITFLFKQIDKRDLPQIVRFITTPSAPIDWMILPTNDSRWIDLPETPAFFSMQTGYPSPKLPTAGPVRLSDVQYNVFHIADLPDLFLQISDDVPFPTGSLTWVYQRDDGSFTVLRSFDTALSGAPNPILRVDSATEDTTVTSTRIYFQQQLAITSADIGSYVVIDGLSQSSPDLHGVHLITAVTSLSIDIVAVSTAGHDFAASLDTAPVVRILRQIRFENIAALAYAALPFVSGDLAWIDSDSNGTWAVLRWNGTWEVVRQQPLRPDPTTISETLIYEHDTHFVDLTMITNQPVVDDVVVIDPLAGLIAGVADREIDFKTEYDPARYNSGNFSFAANPWGANEVGRVWWDLTTVRFLDPCTDVLGISIERDIAELTYRAENWTHVAPKSSVDVYEWVESSLDPIAYAARYPDLVVYQTDNPSWVTIPSFSSSPTLYYFWVKGLTTTPTIPKRHMDVSSVALAIENPTGLDIPWMAPIHQDAIIVSGIIQFLNDQTTAMKVRLTRETENTGRHDQWILLRERDDNSFPPAMLWDRLRDSLSGFDIYSNSIPDPLLSEWHNTGIDKGQSMFSNGRTGLLAARRSYVEAVNSIFARTPLIIEQADFVESLRRPVASASPGPGRYLIWTQTDASYVFEPPPNNEWSVQVYSLTERNRLLARQNIQDAVTNGDRVRVLLNGIGEPTQRWSIWEIDPAKLANPNLLNQHPDTVFQLATSYDIAVDSIDERNLLVSPNDNDEGLTGWESRAWNDTGWEVEALDVILTVGSRVLVTSAIAGFWVIYKWMGAPTTGSFADGFVIWRVQPYRTDDFVLTVDWYSTAINPLTGTAYAAISPPIVRYNSIAERDEAEGATPNNLFVRTGAIGEPWTWDTWDQSTETWNTVAINNGTIALSDAFFDANRVLYGFGFPGWDAEAWDIDIWDDDLLRVIDIDERDGSWELRVIFDAILRNGVLQNQESALDLDLNEIFFSMLNFIHVQQNHVAWAFKTSYLTMLGYNVALQQTPTQLRDDTSDLISYVSEIKPYHVKIRDFVTEYNVGVDLGIVQPNEIERTFDISLLFDRVTGSPPTWDVETWDNMPWDADFISIFILVMEVDPNGLTLRVDDVRHLVYKELPLKAYINDHLYWVSAITQDIDNVSPIRHGASGLLTVITGWETTPWNVPGWNDEAVSLLLDAVPGAVIEMVVPHATAATRIKQSYQPTAGMPPNDLTLLLGLDRHPPFAQGRLITPSAIMNDPDADWKTPSSTVSFVTTVDAAQGVNLLTFASTIDAVIPGWDNIAVNQQVFATYIPKGTIVTDKTATTVTLSNPLTGMIVADSTILFNLPNLADGSNLSTLSGQTSAFDITGFDTAEFDVPVGSSTVEYDGWSLSTDPQTIASAVWINPALTSRLGGLDLRAPYYAANHPEERIPVTSDDGLHFNVHSLPEVGGPPQRLKSFDVSHLSDSTVTLFFDLIAQSSDAVLVYCDGIRNVDFSIDYFARTVTVDIIGVDQVIIHAFGFGGVSTVTDQYYLTYTGDPFEIEQETSQDNVMVVVDGATLDPSDYEVDGDVITLSPQSDGADVAIVLYEDGISTASQIQFQVLAYNVDQTWQLDPFDTDTVPPWAGAIVEVNGIRLRPPTTYYGAFTSNQPWMVLPTEVDANLITIYTKGISGGYGEIPFGEGVYGQGTSEGDSLSVYDGPIEVCTSSSADSSYPFKLDVSDTSAKFAIAGRLLVALDNTISDDVAVLLVSDIDPEYVIQNGLLTIVPVLDSGDLITITWFTNANSMGWKTVSYQAQSVDHYLAPMPFVKDCALVTIDGLAVSPADYEFTISTLGGWNDGAWEDLPFDFAYEASELEIEHAVADSAWIVASVCTEPMAREEFQWMANTITPASTRMPPVFDEGSQLTGIPTYGTSVITPQPMFDIRFGYVHQSPYLAGNLLSDLTPNASHMYVNLLLRNISSKLEPQFPLPSVAERDPGVVWVGGERIEYYKYERIDDAVILSGLRRGTQGTSIAEQREIMTAVGTGEAVTYTLDSIGPVEILVNGVPTDDFMSSVDMDLASVVGFGRVGSLGEPATVSDDELVTHLSGTTTIQLTANVGASIVIGITSGFTYPLGTIVYNGKELMAGPPPAIRRRKQASYGSGPYGQGFYSLAE